MCWLGIPPRTTPLNETKLSPDSGEIILEASPNCHFFETLDWSESQQAAVQEEQLICYDNGNGCNSSNSSLLLTSNTEFVSSVPSTLPPSPPTDLLDLQDLDTTKTAHNCPQTIALDEFSLLFTSRSEASNPSKIADLLACTKESTQGDATAIKITKAVKPDRRQKTCGKSHIINQEKRKNVDESFAELLSLQGIEEFLTVYERLTRNYANKGCLRSRSGRSLQDAYHYEELETLISKLTSLSAERFWEGSSLEPLSQGFTVSRRSNPALNEIRRAEEDEKLSPVSIKIQDWVNGKEGNIRALLASLSDVLWEGAERQHYCMADLLNENQVKKCYHRACLLVHPDKHVGQDHEELARAIFTELNEAWNVFVQNSRFSK